MYNTYIYISIYLSIYLLINIYIYKCITVHIIDIYIYYTCCIYMCVCSQPIKNLDTTPIRAPKWIDPILFQVSDWGVFDRGEGLLPGTDSPWRHATITSPPSTWVQEIVRTISRSQHPPAPSIVFQTLICHGIPIQCRAPPSVFIKVYKPH